MTDPYITDHVFIEGRTGLCDNLSRHSDGWEMCGQGRDHHVTPPRPRSSIIIDQIREEERVAEERRQAAVTQAWREQRAPKITINAPDDPVETARKVAEKLKEMQPQEDPLLTHEATKRVLFHVVAAYQSWRDFKDGVPNEFTDDAVRIGEQHLKLVDWFPEDAGWFRHGADLSPHETNQVRSYNVLQLIDEELERLDKEVSTAGTRRLRSRAWADGVWCAREASRTKLLKIREAYLTEQALQNSAELGHKYGIEDDGI